MELRHATLTCPVHDMETACYAALLSWYAVVHEFARLTVLLLLFLSEIKNVA